MTFTYFHIPLPPQLLFKSFFLVNRNRDEYAGWEADQVSGLAENTSAFPLPGPNFTGQCRGTSAGFWRAPHRRCACTPATTLHHQISPLCEWPSTLHGESQLSVSQSSMCAFSGLNKARWFLSSENKNKMVSTAFSSDSGKSAVTFFHTHPL